MRAVSLFAVCAAALSGLVTAQNADVPRFLRTAYYGSNVHTNDGMIIGWTTTNQTATSTCYYGLAQTALTNTITGTEGIYVPLAHGGTVHHSVTILGLTPDTTYYYKCGDNIGGYSAILSFTTAPATPTTTSNSEFPAKIITYGDMGLYNSQNSMADVRRLLPNASFVFHIGDIGYPDDAFLHDLFHFVYEKQYNEWMGNMSDVTAAVPYMVLPGNHEAECHSPACIFDGTLLQSIANFSSYNTRWRMPHESSGSPTNMWYSFRYGSIHMVSIDTETDFPGAPGDNFVTQSGGFGNQLAWLEGNLQQAFQDRQKGLVSWIIVGGHRPVYSSNECDVNGYPKTDASKAVQAAFENLFHQYGVDLYIAGHVHSYESIYPVYNTTNVYKSYNNPPYTAYVVHGCAGNTEGHNNFPANLTAPWTRFNNTADYGVSVLDIQDRNTLTYTFRRGTDGATIDSFTITKK